MPAPTAATDLTVKTVKWDESDLTLAEHMHVLEPVLLAIDPRFKNLWTHGIASERHLMIAQSKKQKTALLTGTAPVGSFERPAEPPAKSVTAV